VQYNIVKLVKQMQTAQMWNTNEFAEPLQSSECCDNILRNAIFSCARMRVGDIHRPGDYENFSILDCEISCKILRECATPIPGHPSSKDEKIEPIAALQLASTRVEICI
jgi:hypothetical protein